VYDMTQKKQQPNRQQTSSEIDVRIQDLINSSNRDEQRPDFYANYVQVSLTNSELFLDFYYLAPDTQKSPPLAAKFVQRVICPQAIAKGLASAIANTVVSYEMDNGVVLPLQRPPSPDDQVVIWPQPVG
jgi:hypothetical protein